VGLQSPAQRNSAVLAAQQSIPLPPVVEHTEFKMVIESADGKFEYLMAEDDRYINLLKKVYGDRVHMPFAYFRVGTVRPKFF
jgi:hypothetical protein